MNRKNKRKSIEIYFVLYLAALVLLISKSNNKSAAGNENDNLIQQKTFDIPFAIKVEKPMLNCRIWTDSIGNQQYYIDSVNYVWNVGEVEDVRYEFVIEDQNLKHSIKLNNENVDNLYAEKMFSFDEDNANKMAIFRWRPTIFEQENKIFIVNIVATAKSLNPQITERIQAKAQFNLIITHDNEMPTPGAWQQLDTNFIDFVQHSQNLEMINSQSFASEAGAKLSLQAASTKITTLANQEWEQKIFCFGANPKVDFLTPPQIKINNSPENNGGTASVAAYQENAILLRGKTPAFGSTKILITISRKNDLSEATTSFEVLPQNIEQATYPSLMYPEQTYIFNPKLPQTSNNYAVLKESGGKIRVANYQGGSFEFSPDESDIDKIFSFERYADNKLVGNLINIKVANYPVPEISRIAEKSKNVLILHAVSYGWRNGKENRIEKLLISGNAKYKPLYGRISANKEKSVWSEQFEIVPLDAAKPFDFKVVAVDSRGAKSKEKQSP